MTSPSRGMRSTAAQDFILKSIFQVPLERPQGGTEYSSFALKFMCLGSDVGGINRKPVKVIFTLETGPGNVIGRYSVDVRICSCPKRDKQQEEAKNQVRELKTKRSLTKAKLSDH